jgi:hypothetical protein
MNTCLAALFFGSVDLLHLAARAADYLLPFIGQIFWALVALFLVLYFRHAIGALINRVFSLKALGIELLTGSMDDVLAARALGEDVGQFTPEGSWSHQVQASKDTIQFLPEKAGNIYFFSHDTMVCYCALITGSDSALINHTLSCVVYHVERFGLKDTVFHMALAKMLNEARNTKEADWTQQRRRREARKLWLIARNVGDLLEHFYPTRP